MGFQRNRRRQQDFGIVGGLGPRASAHLLSRLYSANGAAEEQEMASITLLSNPRCPDRSSTIENGSLTDLQDFLRRQVCRFDPLYTDGAIIYCITAHAVFDDIRHNSLVRLYSIVDLLLEKILEIGEPHLILCSRGSYTLGIFSRSQLWKEASKLVTYPERREREEIHRLIMAIKTDKPFREEALLDVARMSQAARLVLGCTELPIVWDKLRARSEIAANIHVVDPADVVSEYISNRTGIVL